MWFPVRASSSSCWNRSRPLSTSSTCKELGLAIVSLRHLVARVTRTCVDPGDTPVTRIRTTSWGEALLQLQHLRRPWEGKVSFSQDVFPHSRKTQLPGPQPHRHQQLHLLPCQGSAGTSQPGRLWSRGGARVPARPLPAGAGPGGCSRGAAPRGCVGLSAAPAAPRGSPLPAAQPPPAPLALPRGSCGHCCGICSADRERGEAVAVLCYVPRLCPPRSLPSCRGHRGSPAAPGAAGTPEKRPRRCRVLPSSPGLAGNPLAQRLVCVLVARRWCHGTKHSEQRVEQVWNSTELARLGINPWFSGSSWVLWAAPHQGKSRWPHAAFAGCSISILPWPGTCGMEFAISLICVLSVTQVPGKKQSGAQSALKAQLSTWRGGHCPTTM